MTVFRAATLRTFLFAFHAGAKELKNATKNICKIQETKLLSKHEVYWDALARLMLSKKI